MIIMGENNLNDEDDEDDDEDNDHVSDEWADQGSQRQWGGDVPLSKSLTNETIQVGFDRLDEEGL